MYLEKGAGWHFVWLRDPGHQGGWIGQACMGQEKSITPGHVFSKPCSRLKHTEMEDTDLHYIREGNQPASTLKRTRPPQYSGH